MIFADLVAGDAIFLDANSFIYHFAPDPVLGPPCSQLLQRIDNQELAGFTSLHLLAEVAHKLMTIEANALFGSRSPAWPAACAATLPKCNGSPPSAGPSNKSAKVAFRSWRIPWLCSWPPPSFANKPACSPMMP